MSYQVEERCCNCRYLNQLPLVSKVSAEPLKLRFHVYIWMLDKRLMGGGEIFKEHATNYPAQLYELVLFFFTSFISFRKSIQ